MSEWSNCPLCGATRENMCACPNPKCADGHPEPPPTLTIGQQTVNEVIRVRDDLRAQIKKLRDDPSALPDINIFLEMRSAVVQVEGVCNEFDRYLTRVHTAWLKANHPDLARPADPTAWVEAQKATDAYLKAHGAPDAATREATDQTP